jgi:hypothetical protein
MAYTRNGGQKFWRGIQVRSSAIFGFHPCQTEQNYGRLGKELGVEYDGGDGHGDLLTVLPVNVDVAEVDVDVDVEVANADVKVAYVDVDLEVANVDVEVADVEVVDVAYRDVLAKVRTMEVADVKVAYQDVQAKVRADRMWYMPAKVWTMEVRTVQKLSWDHQKLRCLMK